MNRSLETIAKLSALLVELKNHPNDRDALCDDLHQVIVKYHSSNNSATTPNLLTTDSHNQDSSALELQPGKYTLEIHTTPDIDSSYAYEAHGEMELLSDGTVMGYSQEGSLTLPSVRSVVTKGQWTANRIEFFYRYGNATHNYAVRVQDIRREEDDDEQVTVATLTGRWTYPPDTSNPRTNGNVQAMILRGPLKFQKAGVDVDNYNNASSEWTVV